MLILHRNVQRPACWGSQMILAGVDRTVWGFLQTKLNRAV